MEIIKISTFLLCWLSCTSALPQSYNGNELQLSNFGVSLIKTMKQGLRHLVDKELESSLQETNTDLNGVDQGFEVKNENFTNYRDLLLRNLANFSFNGVIKNDQHSILKKWNVENCADFRQDCLEAVNLTFNSTMLAVNIGLTSSDIVAKIMKCPTWNIVKIYECYSNNMQAVEDLISYAKTEALLLIESAVQLGKKLITDFKTCAGVQYRSNNSTDR